MGNFVEKDNKIWHKSVAGILVHGTPVNSNNLSFSIKGNERLSFIENTNQITYKNKVLSANGYDTGLYGRNGVVAGLYDKDDNLIVKYNDTELSVDCDYYSDSPNSNNDIPIIDKSHINQVIKNYPTAVKLVIPTSCNRIGNYAITETIWCNNDNGADTYIDGCGQLNEVVLPDSIIYIGYENFHIYGDDNHSSKYIKFNIPYGLIDFDFNMVDKSITVVDISNMNIKYSNGQGANSNIKEVYFPKTLELLSEASFAQNQSLTKVHFESNSNIEFAGWSHFFNCTNLTSVNLNEINVKSISRYMFARCTKLTITIPDTVTEIGEDAFLNVAHVYYNGTATGAPWGALAYN